MFTMNFAPDAVGVVICPEAGTRVTVSVFGNAPEAEPVMTKVPGFITEIIAAEKLPAPASEVLPDWPQLSSVELGDTTRAGATAASALSPCCTSNVAVSIVLPVASVTMKATFPQPCTNARKLPPLVATFDRGTATPSCNTTATDVSGELAE